MSDFECLLTSGRCKNPILLSEMDDHKDCLVGIDLHGRAVYDGDQMLAKMGAPAEALFKKIAGGGLAMFVFDMATLGRGAK